MAFAKTAFLTLCLIIAIANVNCQCGPNEEFSSCGSCDGSCGNPSPICINSCMTGCFCRDDYVRDDNGKCIKLGDC